MAKQLCLNGFFMGVFQMKTLYVCLKPQLFGVFPNSSDTQ